MKRFFERRPAVALALGATLVSGAPILVKAAGQTGMGPTAMAMWRCILGTLILGVAARFAGSPLRLRRGVMLAAGFAGLAFAIDLWVWHRSILLAGAGLATLLGNTQVFVTALLSAWLFRERLSLRFGFAAVSAVGGIALLVGVGSGLTFPPGYHAGVGYGLATGLIYGVFLVLLRFAGRGHEDETGFALPLWFTAIAAIVLSGTVAVEQRPAMPPTMQAWLLLGALAFFAQGIGWWIITRSLPRVGGAIGGLLLLLQPVLAMVWGLLLFDEQLASLQWLGAAVTLAAIYVGARKHGHRNQERSSPETHSSRKTNHGPTR